MIFLTVGTTEFPFKRLLKAVDKTLVVLEVKEKLVAQVGPSDHQFVYSETEAFSWTSFPKMINYLARARVVITHGGAGTILLALRYASNKPLVIPRSKEFNEHVDDHQIDFCQFLKKRSLIKAVFPEENLITSIRGYIKHPEKLFLKKRTSSPRKLVKQLIEYTENG